MSTPSAIPLAPRKAEEDVWSYPRPPLLQRVPNTLKVVWYPLNNSSPTIVAETSNAYRVCETSHPPTYYLPPDSVKIPINKTPKKTYCEWKGNATYWSVNPGKEQGGKSIDNRIWSYERPTEGFKALKDHLSFYAATGLKKEVVGGEWRCFVDDEQVGVQEGDFYGGWITSNIKGKMKGGPGTWGW